MRFEKHQKHGFFFFQIFNQKIGSDVSQCEKIPPVTAGSEDGAIHA
jgi:hypothetical protein